MQVDAQPPRPSPEKPPSRHHGLTALLDKGHFLQLTLVFCVWKSLLLCLATFCPGPGYDTSALVLSNPHSHRHEDFSQISYPHQLVLNLFRWDALYFVKAADRGYKFEQDWAFSRAYSQVLRVMGHYASGKADSPLHTYIVAGILASNICHYVSVFVLYRLLMLVLDHRQQRSVALVASVLHIFTPASLFYSAPYAEAMFSCLNMFGMLQYAESYGVARNAGSPVRETAHKLLSGLSFAAATLLRSNGLLSGLLYVYDLARYLPLIFAGRLHISDLRRILVTCLTGICVAFGFILPQYQAYRQFCGDASEDQPPPWCERRVPSIYSWVQSHYWNVGLFRYWTIPNAPLFLMAAPMLWLLLQSGVTTLYYGAQRELHELDVRRHRATDAPDSDSSLIYLQIWSLPELALPQLVLAVAAMTSFHVQIINRIASAYPVWYATLAYWLVESANGESLLLRRGKQRWIVHGIIMYAMIQGMLFANFLPPA